MRARFANGNMHGTAKRDSDPHVFEEKINGLGGGFPALSMVHYALYGFVFLSIRQRPNCMGFTGIGFSLGQSFTILSRYVIGNPLD